MFPDPNLFNLTEANIGPIESICFPTKTTEKQSKIIVGASRTGFVYIWDLNRSELLHKQQMGETIQTIHAYDDQIITQEKSGAVKIWTAEETGYKMAASFQTDENDMGFSKSVLIGNKILLPRFNGTIDVVSIDDMTKISQLGSNGDRLGPPLSMEPVEIDGENCVLAGYDSRQLILWNLSNFKSYSSLKMADFEAPTSLTFDSDKSRGIFANNTNILRIFSIKSDMEIRIKAELEVENRDCCWMVKLRPSDKRFFAVAGKDHLLGIYSWKNFTHLANLRSHTSYITDIQFSAKAVTAFDSKIMSTSDCDGVIALWKYDPLPYKK